MTFMRRLLMHRLTQITVLALVLALFALPALADTLVLKSGERVSGYYEGGSARTVKFRAGDGVAKDYDILSIQQIQFGDTTAPKPAISSGEPRLTPGSERVTRPTASNAANTGFTIPTG